MIIDFLIEGFRARPDADAIVWKSRVHSYGMLADDVARSLAWLDENGIERGRVVALEADFSPASVAMMLALIEHACCVVPLTATVEARKPEFRAIAQAECIVAIDQDDAARLERTGVTADHPLLQQVRASGRPSLILFSSGSTGTSKAALHDFVPLLEKFKMPRKAKRMISFLLFDHIGGVNTMLYALSNGGCLVTVQDRSPVSVARAIEQFRVEILPTSPTFLNLLLLSEAHRDHDLSSLELITYGTEPMPESTLRLTHETFPAVALQQTYGLSELGILRSKSRSSDSLWVKVGGEGFETRVVDGLLEIKAHSAMLGYLNAPSPFTADGWFMTGDAVEVDGDYLHILGRRSELINVGGEKVYPAEVESVVAEMEEVEDVVVTGEPNAIVGHIVKATVRLRDGADPTEFKQRLQRHCRSRLQPFMVPQRVVFNEEQLHSERFKKLRAPR